MPAIVALVAQQGVEVARLVDQLGELLERRRRPGLGPERRDHLVLVDLVARQQLRPGRCLVPNSRRRSSRPSASRIRTRERAVLERGALVEELQPPGRHQVDQQGERLAPFAGRSRRASILPIRRDALDPARPRARRAAGRRSSASPARAPAPTRPRRRRAPLLRRRAVISTSGSSGMQPEGRLALTLVSSFASVSRAQRVIGRRGRRTSNVEGAARHAGAADRPTELPAKLSAEEIATPERGGPRARRRAQRRHPRPQLPAARGPGRRRLRRRLARPLARRRRRPTPR